MALRYDFASLSRTEVTPEGFVRARATFARDGILEYCKADGSVVKELRLPEINSSEEVLSTYANRPVTIEHPPTLLNTQNARDYTVGMTDSSVSYNSGLVSGAITLFDSEAIRLARSGEKTEISAGYQCDIDPTPGTWNGERYDAKQMNVRVNHVCLTSKGRAGENVRLHLDSIDSNYDDVGFQLTRSDSILTSRMDTTNIRIDSIEYQVPVVIAPLINAKLQELETYKQRADTAESELGQIKETFEETEDERDRERGRADALELQLEEMRYELETREDAECAKCGGKGKKHTDKSDYEDEEEEDEGEDEEMDMDDDEEIEEEIPARKAFKSKSKTKTDSISSSEVQLRLDTLLAAENLIPDIRNDGWNSSMSATEIQALVLQKFDSDFDPQKYTNAYIQGRFDSLIASKTSTRSDSFLSEGMAAISFSRGANLNPYETASNTLAARIESNWQQPLAYSKGTP